MKKYLSFLTLSLLIGIGVLNAQNARTVVLECFTSASCGPCAQYNPALDNLINNNADHLIAIKYHVNWPSDTDPMNHHNPAEVSARRSYYNINSVPYSVGDGTWSNTSNNVTQNLINQWAAVDSPIEMRMTHYLNATQDTIFVVVMGRATSPISSDNLRLQIVVLEETMEYASAPSSNGERIFHNVMKKMLPGSSGTSIPAMAAGEYFAYKYSWALANVMDINELTAVAWLQDHNTKQVFQGCKSSDNFQPFYEKQAKITSIDHAKQTVCSGNFNPDIVVENFGSETINSLVINVAINNTELDPITWQGNVETGKSVKINLGELNFDVENNNSMTIQIAQINGAADDYESSVFNYSFDEAPLVVNKSLKLTIRTDNNPEAITWDVVNTETGEIVANGGPYAESHKLYNENFDINEDGCYMVTIYDAMGDGLLSGSGLYVLKAGTTTLFSGGAFNDKDSNEFSYMTYQDIPENTGNYASIYPNPSNGLITIDVEGTNVLTVYNTAGQLVYNQSINDKTTVDLSKLEKGTYLMVLTNNVGENAKQIIVLQ